MFLARECPKLNHDELRRKLPKLGTVIFQTPKILINEKDLKKTHPRIGVVTYINEEHLWFLVEFLGTGVLIKECLYPYEDINIVGHVNDDPRTWRIKHE